MGADQEGGGANFTLFKARNFGPHALRRSPPRESHPPKRVPVPVFVRSAKIIFRPIAGAIVARNDCRAPNAGERE